MARLNPVVFVVILVFHLYLYAVISVIPQSVRGKLILTAPFRLKLRWPSLSLSIGRRDLRHRSLRGTDRYEVRRPYFEVKAFTCLVSLILLNL